VTPFRSFSFPHIAALLVISAVIAAGVTAGHAWRGSSRQQRLERGIAVSILLLRAGVFAWNLLPGRLALSQSLPLQICDLAALCSAFSLLVDRRWLRSIAYFWGLALSMQGLIQPDLSDGPDSLAFWLFWTHHALIVGTAVYLVTVRGFRPKVGDLGFAVATGVGYALVVFCVDLALDVNYGYLGKGMPAQPTLLDWLGPWPWRVALMVALGVLVMSLLFVPWTIRSSSPRQQAAAPTVSRDAE
jgi:hypothetical integral membrane protein (TIGR02206 family)